MNRKKFMVQCSLSCAGLITGSIFMVGCTATKIIQATENAAHEVRIDPAVFIETKKEQSRYLRSVLVKTATLDYPILLYRHSAEVYQALLLRCTHQGTVLNAYGDLITCSAHGSEFNTRGEVLNGPATRPLTSFPVGTSGNEIVIKIA